jgi:transposase
MHNRQVPGASCPIKIKLDAQAGEIQFLKDELAELRAKMYGRKHKQNKSEEKEEDSPKPKKRGAPPGHPCWFRKKPDKIDEVIDVKSSCCPHCGNNKITPCAKVEEHIQEDIILPMVKATLYRKQTYYCNNCQANFSGRGKDELLNSYIGPTAKTLSCILKYHIKVSDRGIQDMFQQFFNLRVSSGSIPGFRGQLSRRGIKTYMQMVEVLRKSSHAHCDETEWNFDGDNQWLWSFSNDRVSVFRIDKSRGQKVVEEVLTDKYDGVTICDFLSAYNKINAKGKQRCLVHL